MPRILLKLSGEKLGDRFGVSESALAQIAKKISLFCEARWQLGVVIGGGNWIRGGQVAHMDRVVADQMGMHATIMNGLALQTTLHGLNIPAKVMSSFPSLGVQSWDYAQALDDLNHNIVMIFVGGTGNPFFTTDSCAALRGIQIHADKLLKTTQVDGIYDCDPNENSDATRYNTLSYNEAIVKNLKVMDLTAFALCRDHKLPIQVCNINSDEVVADIIAGKPVGTLVSDECADNESNR